MYNQRTFIFRMSMVLNLDSINKDGAQFARNYINTHTDARAVDDTTPSVSNILNRVAIDPNDYSPNAYDHAAMYLATATRKGIQGGRATRRRRSSKRMSRKMNKRRR